MLTTRGWWFLIVVVLQVVLGVVAVPTWTITPAVVGLALLLWFGYEWAAFQWRLNACVSKLYVERRLVQGERDVPMVWAGVPFAVRVEVGFAAGPAVPYVTVEDVPPPGADRGEGETSRAGRLAADRPAVIEYTLLCPTLGVMRFEGVGVRVADLHGFFYHRAFLREAGEVVVLPRLGDDEGHQRATKRFNTLPPPGVHRLRRPGSGGELLDLRDYRAGDPPKMIAWKASARRDRLITKEFESDVPVRCVLFLDTSEGVRLGPTGETPGARLAGLAAGVAQAAAGGRDLVGLTTFDETAAATLPPARTRAHLVSLLRRLAEAAALPPTVSGVTVPQMVRRGTAAAREWYPDLMNRGANAVPFGRLWKPLLDTRWGWLALVWIAVTPLLVTQKFWFVGTSTAALHNRPDVSPGWLRFVLFLALWAALLFSPALIALFVWVLHGARGWFNPRRRELTQRKRLSAVVALTDGSGAAGVERYVHDDDAFTAAVGRFLTRHRVRYPVPLYDAAGRYRYRGEGKAGVLAAALVRAVGHARDNELYVVLADLAELGPDLAPVVKAARMARGRHHQVLVIVPWPAGVPDPGEAPATPEPATRPPAKGRNRKGLSAKERRAADRPAVHVGLVLQLHHAYRDLRRELTRAGATVVRVNEADPVRVVLDRLDRLRGMRTRR